MHSPDSPVAPGRMSALGLDKPVVLVLFLLRQNPVQKAPAELFGVSQATVSRRWTALLPVVEKVLAGHVPDPAEASAGRIVLVDGTLVTTWDWRSEDSPSAEQPINEDIEQPCRPNGRAVHGARRSDLCTRDTTPWAYGAAFRNRRARARNAG
ncbi:transposase family protein [Streptomyces sp. NPDC096030]|uniref:transposase family protein n=1 Tax=Streptomyces sp. NPDC096030 TaxID=3155423 RepID=UPI003323BA07